MALGVEALEGEPPGVAPGDPPNDSPNRNLLSFELNRTTSVLLLTSLASICIYILLYMYIQYIQCISCVYTYGYIHLYGK